jgi:hypothetical protein
MELPTKGFYCHYKHDPAGEVNNYSYEVLGVARHTEELTRTVVYRALYENSYAPPADFSARPLEMFMESVSIDGKEVPRFTQITDPEIIAKLEAIKKEMYG